jgi:polyphosphate glucokinase
MADKKVLAIDIGGTHVKILATGRRQKREVDSGLTMTAEKMVEDVKQLAQGWDFDVICMGCAGAGVREKRVVVPGNVGSGWCGVDFWGGVGRPVMIVDVALVEAGGR